MYIRTYLKVTFLRMGRKSRRKEMEVGCVREFLKENGFATVLCSAPVASGIIGGICLNSSAWGYVLTRGFYS